MTLSMHWRNLRGQAEHAASLFAPRWWGFVVAAAILGGGVAELIYRHLDRPQAYSELIVGAIAWTYEDKFHDYALLVGFVLAFLAALAFIALLAARLKNDFGLAGVRQFHDHLLLLCAPAGLWLGGLMTTKDPSLRMLHVSQFLLATLLILVSGLAYRGPGFWRRRSADLFGVALRILLCSILAVFSVCAIGVAFNRLGARVHAHQWFSGSTINTWAAIAAVAVLGLSWILVASAANTQRLDLRLKRLAIGLQSFLPLLLLCLIPPAWTWSADKTLASGYRLSIIGNALVLGAMAWAAFDLVRLARRVMGDEAAIVPALKLLSNGSAVAVLLFLKMAPVGLAVIPADDYHFGEMLVPWWSWIAQGMLPFWDYAPARGMFNYIPGALSVLLFDGTPASLAATYGFMFVAMVPFALTVLRRHVGMGVAFMALLLGPSVNGYCEIDLVTTAFIAFLCCGYFQWMAQRWLTTFATLGAAILLYTPGQGALALIACTPMAILQAWRLYAMAPRKLMRWAALFGTATAALMLLTPLGPMLAGAVRYGAEQSSINSVAHGINWNASFNTADANPWLFEFMRVGWLGVAVWAAALFIKAWCGALHTERTKVLVYASAIFVVLMLFIVRTAGRIDGGPSRLGQASSWALTLLAPLLLSLVVRIRGVHALVWATVAGMVTPYYGGLALSTLARNFTPVEASTIDYQRFVRLRDDPLLGSADIDRSHLERIAATRNVLDSVLTPQETYLDLTGRHAMYFYVGRRPAIETGAMYNLVGEAQQLRAIEAVRTTKPPAILLSSDNITHDGGPSSLRSNLLYREVLLLKGYKLVSVGRQLWMIRTDRLPGLSKLPLLSIRDLDNSLDNPLLAAFYTPALRSVPASWGRSYARLQEEVQTVFTVTPSMQVARHDLKQGDDGRRFIITGADPFVRFDISSAHVRGQDAGLLSFDFACDSLPGAVPQLRFFWTSAGAEENASASFSLEGRQGRLVIPVDSSPAWLLSPQIATIRFDVENELQACARFSITNVRLLRRTATMAQGKPAQ